MTGRAVGEKHEAGIKDAGRNGGRTLQRLGDRFGDVVAERVGHPGGVREGLRDRRAGAEGSEEGNVVKRSESGAADKLVTEEEPIEEGPTEW